MARRRIGQEILAFVSSDAGRRCSLDDLHDLIDWAPIDRRLASISCSAKGEPASRPLALFKAMLLAMWYDLSDVKFAEALDDRASFEAIAGSRGMKPRRSAPPSFGSGKPSSLRPWTRRCSTKSPPNSRPRRSGQDRNACRRHRHCLRERRRRPGALGQTQRPGGGLSLQGACRRRRRHGSGRGNRNYARKRE